MVRANRDTFSEGVADRVFRTAVEIFTDAAVKRVERAAQEVQEAQQEVEEFRRRSALASADDGSR